MSGLHVDLRSSGGGEAWIATGNFGATGTGPTLIAALEDLVRVLKEQRDRALDESLATTRREALESARRAGILKP